MEFGESVSRTKTVKGRVADSNQKNNNFAITQGDFCFWFLNAQLEIKCEEEGIEFKVTGEQHCECPDDPPQKDTDDPQGERPSEYGEYQLEAQDLGCLDPPAGSPPNTPDSRTYKIKKIGLEGVCPKPRPDIYGGDPLPPIISCDGASAVDKTDKITWEEITEALEGKYHEEGGEEDQNHHPLNIWRTSGDKVHRVVSRGLRGMAKECDAAEGTDSDGSETLDVTEEVAECMARNALCCDKGNDSTAAQREAVMEQILRKKILDKIPKIACIFDVAVFGG